MTLFFSRFLDYKVIFLTFLDFILCNSTILTLFPKIIFLKTRSINSPPLADFLFDFRILKALYIILY